MGAGKLPPGVRISRGAVEVRFTAKHWETGEAIRFQERLFPEITEANIRAAGHTVAEVKQDSRLGLLTAERYAQYFPGTRYVSIDTPAAMNPLFEEQAQAYLDTFSPSQAKGARAEYLKVLNGLWVPSFAGRRVKSIRASEIERIIAQADFQSARTRNNNLTPLRGLFKLLEKDRIIGPDENPMRQIEWERPPRRVAETIDPLTVEEMHLVLDWMRDNADTVYWRYFQLAFATGMRNPSELTALHWDCIDFRQGSLRVKRKLTRQMLYETTKTGDVRDIALPSLGIEALEGMKPLTFLQGEYVFMTPHGNTMRSPTKTVNPVWNRCLKKLGIRHREMRQTRHTTATHWIMAGANLKWVANQLGHDVSTLEKHYAKWLDAQGTQAEIEKIDQYQKGVIG